MKQISPELALEFKDAAQATHQPTQTPPQFLDYLHQLLDQGTEEAALITVKTINQLTMQAAFYLNLHVARTERADETAERTADQYYEMRAKETGNEEERRTRNEQGHDEGLTPLQLGQLYNTLRNDLYERLGEIEELPDADEVLYYTPPPPKTFGEQPPASQGIISLQFALENNIRRDSAFSANEVKHMQDSAKNFGHSVDVIMAAKKQQKEAFAAANRRRMLTTIELARELDASPLTEEQLPETFRNNLAGRIRLAIDNSLNIDQPTPEGKERRCLKTKHGLALTDVERSRLERLITTHELALIDLNAWLSEHAVASTEDQAKNDELKARLEAKRAAQGIKAMAEDLL